MVSPTGHHGGSHRATRVVTGYGKITYRWKGKPGPYRPEVTLPAPTNPYLTGKARLIGCDCPPCTSVTDIALPVVWSLDYTVIWFLGQPPWRKDEGMKKYAHLVHAVRKLKPGEAYIAAKGSEFDCQPESFRGVVYQLAAIKGGGWKGTASVVGSSVIYCFYKDSDFMRPNLPAYPLVLKMKGHR
jgi:hypothetical protein